MNFKAGFISVVGRPNVGKSTLVNELIGRKLSITSHRVQTTRHRINAIVTTDNYQMVFTDTPGIHIGNKNAINSYMNKVASTSIKEVDIILWLIEVNKFNKEDMRVMEHISQTKVPVILGINKIDKLKTMTSLLTFLVKIKKKYNFNEIFPLSAFNKKDVKKLRLQILKYLPVQSFIFDKQCITDRSEKFIVTEFIREKLIRHLSAELPYGVTVDIEKYKLEKKIQHISACIYVNKLSHKNIVIGRNGIMLKNIGTEARLSIESFLYKKVFLQLWVKLANNWVNNKNKLASLGYD